MSGIDWNRYTQLCEDIYTPAIDRFADTLRKAAGVATIQSMPIYTGTMKANLVTVFMEMKRILKQMAKAQLPEEEWNRIRWRDVEERMRETWFKRLCGIKNLPIADDYVQTRIYNKSSDSVGLCQWVSSLQKKPSEINHLAGQIFKETALFILKDVPEIMEFAKLGIRKPR